MNVFSNSRILVSQVNRNEKQKGLISIEFVFSFSAAIILFYFMFMMALTFVAAETAQYITFSVSRSYFAASSDDETQEQNAIRQFDSLLQKGPFKSLFAKKDGFFELKIADGGIGDIGQSANYTSTRETIKFIGARLKFTSKVLNMEIPILGSTGIDEEGFTAYLNSFLYREPNADNCKNFFQTNSRINTIFSLLQFNSPASAYDPNQVKMPEDNGC